MDASARLIVCERSGRWGSRLRRELADEGRWIGPARSLSQLRDLLNQHPASLVVLELTRDNLQPASRAIAQLHDDFPRAGLIVVTRRPLSGCQWSWREAGAAHVVTDALKVGEIGRIWKSHCRRFPPVEQTHAQRIRDRLPWRS